jgi:hypothetical protein
VTDTAFYTGLRDTAHRMLGDKGRTMTLHKVTPGTYDPSTGSAPITTTDYTCTGAEFDYPALLIDGTSIQYGDKKVLLSAQGLSAEPDVGDDITAGSTKRRIIASKAVAPSGTVVVWQLQVRR